MNRDTLLNEINDLIESEMGNRIEESDTIVSSEIDSLGLTIVLGTIGDKYGIYDNNEFKELDFSTLTAGDVIDRILDANS